MAAQQLRVLQHQAVAGEGDSALMLEVSQIRLTDYGEVEADPCISHLWTELANDRGNLQIQFALGTFLANALGDVDPAECDFASAYELLHRAASQGHGHAALFLSRLYKSGKGVDANDIEERRWFTLAIDTGSAIVLYACAMQIIEEDQDGVRAMDLLERAIRENVDPPGRYDLAAYTLGQLHWSGDEKSGVKINRKLGYEWLMRAADPCGLLDSNPHTISHSIGECCRGDPRAQFALACYLTKVEGGRPVSPPVSIRLLSFASASGHGEAQFMLAVSYLTGDGVIIDFDVAFSLFKESASQNIAQAQCLLGNCYRDGIGCVCDIRAAMKWYRLSAEAGNADAQFSLAQFMIAGNVSQDSGILHEAMGWFHKSAAQGFEKAIEVMAQLGYKVAMNRMGQPISLSHHDFGLSLLDVAKCNQINVDSESSDKATFRSFAITSLPASSSSKSSAALVPVCAHCSLSQARLLLCSGCKTVRFCSETCQREFWPRHRTLCRQIAARSSVDAGTSQSSTTNDPKSEQGKK